MAQLFGAGRGEFLDGLGYMTNVHTACVLQSARCKRGMVTPPLVPKVTLENQR